MKHLVRGILCLLFLGLSSVPASAALITFDDLITGQTVYDFDADGDGLADARFSTPDPSGFNTIGPGLNQLYIQEPGLEGTTLLPVDLRVDFLVGAEDFIRFGFAVNAFGQDITSALDFRVFNSSNVELASLVADAVLGSSTYPEAQLELLFSGVAAYATFNYDNPAISRYIVDNFEGNFGTRQRVVPEPSGLALGLLALTIGVAGFRRNRR